mmetsp:Transcript_19022/g.31125  ORF Transcript_19022/g.31125 Transcript_19022/m.31125 type:complete len:411 (+) Transcript_19022:54-1286(+)
MSFGLGKIFSRGLSTLPPVRDRVMIRAAANTHDEIKDSVRALCSKFPGEYWQVQDREKLYPKEFVDELTQSGYLSLLIPEKYGGSGLGLEEACVVMEEIHRSGCNGGAAHAQMYTMGTILRYGSEEQKQEYLPKIARGELRLQAFGVSEPNSGTDTLSLETIARPHVQDGVEGYMINGTKLWTSRAEHSDLMLLLARTGDSNTPRRDCLSTFLIDMRKETKLTIKPIETMVNHSTCQVFFDNLFVPKGNLVGEEGSGFRYILGSMNAERILIASECIGDARFFIDRATTYSKERVVFGRPIGQNQGIQFPISQAYVNIEAASLMVQAAAALYSSNQDCGPQANMAKYLASEASWAAGEACMQTYGGFAFATEYDIERKWREARLYRIAPISSNLILTNIAEKVLGMPRSF